MGADERTRAAEALLREHGLPGEVSAEGPQGEIAALRVSDQRWERLMAAESGALVQAIRALGFRYVALDLLAAEPPGP